MFWKKSTAVSSADPSPVILKGFWCMPIGGERFMKLPIYDFYNSGGTRKYLFNGNRIDAAWAIVAGAKFLTKHFPWILEAFDEIEQSCGTDVFLTGQQAYQEYALDLLTKKSFEQRFVYVLQETVGDNTVLIGSSQIAFPDALYAELTGGIPQTPPGIRLPPVQNGIRVDYRGYRGTTQPLDQMLRGANPI